MRTIQNLIRTSVEGEGNIVPHFIANQNQASGVIPLFNFINMENHETAGAGNDNRQAQDERLVHAKLSDAASDNEREAERIQEAGRAAEPSYELHTQNEGRLKTTEQGSSQKISDTNNNSQAEKSEPADADETARSGEEIGGITNLSLEQLKKEGGPSSGEEDR